MPEWLLKKDNYVPKRDKDAFIDKSILSILGIVSRFKVNTNYRINKLGANAFVKLISALIILIFISLTKSFTFAVIFSVVLLVIINFLTTKEIIYILKLAIAAGGLTFIIFLPSILLGYGNNSFLITLKVLLSVTTVGLLACTTQWNELIAALKVFHVPDIFIFVLDITMKYIIILGEFALNMVYALKLRSIGYNKKKNTFLSGIIGTLFIKSKEMSEEMYNAMECRGFSGEYKTYIKIKFKLTDYIFVIFDVIFILIYFYFDRL